MTRVEALTLANHTADKLASKAEILLRTEKDEALVLVVRYWEARDTIMEMIMGMGVVK